MRTPTTVFGPTTTIGGCALGAQALDQVVHLGGVAARVDAVRDVPDDALLVDDESGAHQALAARAALILLLLQHAVLAADLALGVREERDGDAVTVAEIGVRQAIVARDAEHHAIVLNKLLFVVGEIGRDQGAAGRAVARHGLRYQTVHGPFKSVRPKRRDWTLLVSGVNLHHADADRLLRRFSFVPQARLDDVMVSYATPGGGVGPHVDSYDVFLLQASGRRRWRIGRRANWVASAGDLVYLPPGVRHDGVALEPCTTYSIGFRAPRGAELGAAFLDWLHERGPPQARYRDPGLGPARAPARIPREMVAFADRVLSRIRWTRGDVERFVGEYLTAPKAHVVFQPQAARRLAGRVRLDPRSQLLYSGRRFFINGDSLTAPAGAAAALRRLADERSAAATALAGARLARLISDWQRRGYVRVESA